MVAMPTSQVTEAQRARAAAVIEARVEELHIEWRDIPGRGGPSASKVREFVRGRSRTFTPSKRRELERALEWESGGFDEAVAGRSPKSIAKDGDGPPDSVEPSLLHALSYMWGLVGDLCQEVLEHDSPELRAKTRKVVLVTLDLLPEVLLASSEAGESKELLQRMFVDGERLVNLLGEPVTDEPKRGRGRWGPLTDDSRGTADGASAPGVRRKWEGDAP